MCVCVCVCVCVYKEGGDWEGLLLLGGFGFELGLPLCRSQGHLGIPDTWREKAARNSIIWRLTKIETFLNPKEEDVCVCVCVSRSVVSNSLGPQ